MLEGSGLRTPTSIHTHGFLTVNGEKMSKSRGTFIKARTYLEHLDPEYLRYYFAGKLGSGIDDIDLNMEDFLQKINSDLVGKVVNIASRCSGFIKKVFANKLAANIHQPELFTEFINAGDSIASAYEATEYAKAILPIIGGKFFRMKFVGKEIAGNKGKIALMNCKPFAPWASIYFVF